MENNDILNALLDKRNATLWRAIQAARTVDIREEIRDHYLIHLSTNSFTVYVPKGDYRPASFTHELLHADLRIKGVSIGSDLRVDLMTNPALSFLDRDLIDHIPNCLEHIKMLPVFLSMGYPKEDFIADYHINKMTDKDMRILKSSYRMQNLYNASGVRFFIGKYFAIKACPNEFFYYKESLEKLRQLDKDLYQILDEFLALWSRYIPGIHKVDVNQFEMDLSKWVEGKVIVEP